ncbi:MAG TPA: hypothetical protein VJI71_00640, partial [Candidatus Norongarragalinales archaeon]|nr:hypothetical protein [Candidatus Norongarragalinales archaeon]
MKKILLAFLVLTAGLVLLGCVQNNATPAAPVATDVRIGVPTATPPASPIATNITIAVPSALEINVTVDAPARNYF